MALAAGCPAAPTAANASCRNLADTEGSLVNNVGSAQNEPTWTNISMGSYNGWIRNGRTGARRLDLPIVSDGATPADLIRRPPVGEAVTSAIGRQRFYNMGTLRIMLSDTTNDITTLPGVVSNPVPLRGNFDPAANGFGGMNGVVAAGGFAAYAQPGRTGERRPHERQHAARRRLSLNRDAATRWDVVDKTREILSLGWIGRRDLDRRQHERRHRRDSATSRTPTR